MATKGNAGSYYDNLRKAGHLYLNPDETWVITGLRRNALRQGLRIKQHKTQGSAITDVWLLDGDRAVFTIVRPDAQEN
jgi:hypothetical protein